MRCFFVVGEPVVAWHPGVVLVDLAEALFPVVELAGADADPGQEATGRDVGLVAPGADEIDDLVAGVVGDPAAGQSSPSSFFNRVCSSMSSAMTAFLRWSLASSCSILLVLGVFGGLGFAAVVEGGVAVLEELLEPGVELGGIEVEFIAKVGNRDLVDEMPS